MYPDKLKPGDEIRIIAPSESLSMINEKDLKEAVDFLSQKDFHITFSKNCRECDDFHSSDPYSRLEDFHQAFSDSNVKAVIACLGGFNANHLLNRLDYSLIASQPKILCGYSDITALLNAIYAKTGLVTYHGPVLSTFSSPENREYTEKSFFRCLTENTEITLSPSLAAKKYDVIQSGSCEGVVVGGNLCTFNLLQGTPFMPDLTDKILFLEDDNIMGEFFPYEFDRNLQSLLQSANGDKIRGIVFGRFEESCRMSADMISKIVRDKIKPDIPVIFNADFGHVSPIITFPVGGRAFVAAAGDKAVIQLKEH